MLPTQSKQNPWVGLMHRLECQGLETSLPVMLTHAVNGKCSIEDVVKWMSTNVAELYQMVGKGK